MGKKKKQVQQFDNTNPNAAIDPNIDRPVRALLNRADQIAFNDATDGYANSFNNYIEFKSTISGDVVRFKAMLTTYEDQYQSEWNSEQVYGRNDPIQTFRNTTRTINVGWDAPAASSTEGAANMIRAAKLIRMLYPSYESRDGSIGNVSTINKPPVLEVKFRNLIQGMDREALLVTLDGITFAPDLEAGWFDKLTFVDLPPELEYLHAEFGKNELVPKLLKFSCTMTVLHKRTVGHFGTSWNSKLLAFPFLPEALANPESGEVFDKFDSTNETFVEQDEDFSFNQHEMEAAQKTLDAARQVQAGLAASEEAKKGRKTDSKPKSTVDKVNQGSSPGGFGGGRDPRDMGTSKQYHGKN